MKILIRKSFLISFICLFFGVCFIARSSNDDGKGGETNKGPSATACTNEDDTIVAIGSKCVVGGQKCISNDCPVGTE